jgi:hypothetical protein
MFSKLINKIKPGTIQANRIVTRKNANTFEVLNNHALAISGAKDIGCQLVNIGPNDLAAGTVRARRSPPLFRAPASVFLTR